MIGSMDIPSIKNLKIGMQTLDLNAIAGAKIRLVLNHANAKVKLDVKEIERVLGLSAELRGARRPRGADVGERRCPRAHERPEGAGRRAPSTASPRPCSGPGRPARTARKNAASRD